MKCPNCSEAEMELQPVEDEEGEWFPPGEEEKFLCPDCWYSEPASERA